MWSVPFGIPSEGTPSETALNDVIVFQNVAAAPIDSYVCSETSTLPVERKPNHAVVPAAVVEAAASLLATEHTLFLPMDPSSSLIDQYCCSLATNILKEICYPVPVPRNAPYDEILTEYEQYSKRQTPDCLQPHEK
jgi:phage gp36-like protein